MNGGETGARRFSVADGMILVAAAAVALVGFRLTADRLDWDITNPRTWDTWGLGALDWVVLALSGAVCVIRVRAPRPDRDRLWRQPGWLAALAAVAIASLDTLDILVRFALQEAMESGSTGYGLGTIFGEILPFHVPEDIGRVVVVTWAILAISGRWTGERSAVDRLGRVAGWYWVIRVVVSPLMVLATY